MRDFKCARRIKEEAKVLLQYNTTSLILFGLMTEEELQECKILVRKRTSNLNFIELSKLIKLKVAFADLKDIWGLS